MVMLLLLVLVLQPFRESLCKLVYMSRTGPEHMHVHGCIKGLGSMHARETLAPFPALYDHWKQ